MSQKGITINTLDSGHVDASDHALLFNSLFGECGVLSIGNKLELSKLTNNKIRMLDGFYIMNNGVIIRVEDFEDLDVDSGTLGKKRIDLVVAEYVKNGLQTGEDTAVIKIINGEYDDEPIAPELTQNETTRQEKIATLLIDSTDMSIQSFDAKPIKTMKDVIRFLSKGDGYVEVEFDTD